MNRRGFLQSILAAGIAPYVVTAAGVLMPVREIWTPLEYLPLQWDGRTLSIVRAMRAYQLELNRLTGLSLEMLQGRAGGASFSAASS